MQIYVNAISRETISLLVNSGYTYVATVESLINIESSVIYSSNELTGVNPMTSSTDTKLLSFLANKIFEHISDPLGPFPEETSIEHSIQYIPTINEIAHRQLCYV